jgi:hypothetical protein
MDPQDPLRQSCPRCSSKLDADELKHTRQCPVCGSPLVQPDTQPRAQEPPLFQDPISLLAILNLAAQVACLAALARGFSTLRATLAHVWLGTMALALVLFVLTLVFKTRRRAILGRLNLLAALGELGFLAFLLFVLFNLAP